MKKIRLWLNEAARRLEVAGVPDARTDAEYLLAHVKSVQRLTLKLNADDLLSDTDAAAFEAFVDRRATRVPLQYLLGFESFMGLRFHTDERALIPRPETELLCEKALDAIRQFPAPQRVLDLCTGTGAIGLSLKKQIPDILLCLSDLSDDALSLAKENADWHHLKATFFLGDLFLPLKNEAPFDVIVCNPPYIPYQDCLVLQQEVRREPLMALDGGKDGLDFYRRLALEAESHLSKDGILLMEIGYDQGESVCTFFQNRYRDVTVYKDYSGLERMVICRRRESII